MKKYFLLVFLILTMSLFITSCKGQEYNNGIFNLQKLSFDLNADKFYSNAMKRENIKFSSDKQYVEKDTIKEYDIDWKGDKNKIFGIQYNVAKYSPKQDTVAQYKEFLFSRLESMTTENGELMLINAVTKSDNNTIDKLITELSAEFGVEPVISKSNAGFIHYKILNWSNDKKIVKLVTESALNFSSPNNVVSEKDKAFIEKVEKDKLTESVLFICNPKYEKKLLGKLNSGNWSRFE